jgi:hypothetical protein
LEQQEAQWNENLDRLRQIIDIDLGTTEAASAQRPAAASDGAEGLARRSWRF